MRSALQTYKNFNKMALIKSGMLAIYMILLNTNVIGQHVEYTSDDFFLTGDSKSANKNCFQLTEASYWEGGGFWFKNKIDLNQPFTAELELSFGCNDEYGADGIVFIFHPYLSTGFAGEGMGFGGLYPSFGIEMDTYYNGRLGDPYNDHIALVRDGSLRHFRGLTPPIPFKEGVDNVEDCQNHKVKIEWNPKNQLVRFFFDGELRISHNIDLVDDIFLGTPEVYWGFTSATGDKYNKHMVCLEELNFKETFALSKKDKTKLLDGEMYSLQNVNFPAGNTKLPERAKSELDEMIRFFHEYPSHSIILEGYTDSSGKAFRNLQLSTNRAKAIADYLKENGIPPERILYYGHGEKDPIAPNVTELGRKKNRRVEVRMRVIRV